MSDAAVANVSRAFALGAMRSRTAIAHTGSSPVSNDVSGPASGAAFCATASKQANGVAALRLRPSQRWRSVDTRTLITCGSVCARKCVACTPRSVARRGVRSNTSACCAASHRARTNRLLNAGCASSARGSARVTSKAEINSMSSVRSLRFRSSTWRNSMSSSGLTQTMVWVCNWLQVASKHTRSAW